MCLLSWYEHIWNDRNGSCLVGFRFWKTAVDVAPKRFTTYRAAETTGWTSKTFGFFPTLFPPRTRISLRPSSVKISVSSSHRLGSSSSSVVLVVKYARVPNSFVDYLFLCQPFFYSVSQRVRSFSIILYNCTMLHNALSYRVRSTTEPYAMRIGFNLDTGNNR